MARLILVADEDTDTRVILRALLERNDFVVIDAATADDAVLAARERAFDMVILNHPMNLADRRPLVEVLRTLENTRDIPVLNLSSRVVPSAFEEARALGVDASLPKPAHMDQVLEIVHRLITPIVVAG